MTPNPVPRNKEVGEASGAFVTFAELRSAVRTVLTATRTLVVCNIPRDRSADHPGPVAGGLPAPLT